MRNPYKYVALAIFLALAGTLAASFVAGQTSSNSGRVAVFGDVVQFLGPTDPNTCIAKSRFKPGEAVGFRMTAVDPATGKRDRATKLVVHLTYGGNTVDLPMHDRQTEKQPEREFWIAKWVVPQDAPVGIVRYTVTAQDPQGRTGEYKPFNVDASQLTIVP